MTGPGPREPRRCGGCSLCCTVLRVDELGKLGGEPCPELRPGGGCGIYTDRPRVCREYRCLWLRGSLEDTDRPDRLGAVVDFAPSGGGRHLAIVEARAGAFDASPRLQAIAEAHRGTLPVRITAAEDVMNPARPVRVLLADGEEQRIEGDRVTVLRPGAPPLTRRAPWLDRGLRRIQVWVQAARIRRAGARARARGRVRSG